MGLSELSFSATNINVGKDADKPVYPKAGDLYIATDTNIMYKCNVDGVWVDVIPALTYDKVDMAYGFPLIMGSSKVKYIDNIGNSIWHANDTTRETTASDWVKIKETYLSHVPASSLKISYDTWAEGLGNRTQSRVYRNGEPVGALKDSWGSRSGSWTTHTEVIDGWQNGDLLQIYVKRGGTPRSLCRNLRILGTVQPAGINNIL